ncbi:NYN domain-containing protein [Leucobacter tenebrionis]|uniref:NYN domain-containing protein n=1 Tax=Leucobacter tenebrionis TaxID=2873270 RepID=UPI001CA7060E|nr:NYN domain-containing protein [Leucobacter tenebrionis]QZY51365.1 NYN domain-containing protein [Leucobacter tenebrionis]
MANTQNGRVAVYLDFDNIVLSWYDRVHGRNSYARDRQRIAEDPSDAEIAGRLRDAVIDVGAVIDYASSYGTLVLTRAYADWSSPINADYRSQLVARAVDLVQLFPAAAYAKNGADIRLAVDAVEDMFRLDDLTHVIIVAGDSDYVPLAQRCKRLGRYVVGIGVAGSTAKALTAACDEFASYDSLPGVEQPQREQQPAKRQRRGKAVAASKETSAIEAAEAVEAGGSGEGEESAGAGEAADAPEAAAETTRGKRGASAGRNLAPAPAESVADDLDDADEGDDDDDTDIAVTGLLIRALWLGQEKDDSGWLHSSAVKQQMRRMDPSFNEKALGFRSFSDFLKSRADVAELEETGHERLVRLRDQTP